ncbi:MAG TPA: PIN domain-containing protein [Mucilaginibacter sp.]
MKSIFIDSDILLDLVLHRDPFYDWAKGLFLLFDSNIYKGCASVHSLLNTHYLAKKHAGEKAARTSIALLASRLNIITEDAIMVSYAIESNFKDFEDAIQFYAAKSAGADYIIIRNLKDYKESTIPVLTAEQFLRTL